MEFQHTVLIIDDDSRTREAYQALLEAAGFSSIGASNGAEAILWLESGTAAMILLDLKMPVMDGWSFLEHRARQAYLRQIPVLVVSGWLDEDETRQALQQLGVDHLFGKPVDMEAFLGTVREILGKRLASHVTPSQEPHEHSRRQDSRVTFTVPIRIRTGSSFEVPGRLCDLSAGGLGAYLPHRLSRGETITVNLDIKGHSLALTGIVQWAEDKSTAGGCRHGIRFAERQEDSFPLYTYSFFRENLESLN